MAEPAISWASRGAWAGVAEPGRFGAEGEAGIIATLSEGSGLASVIVAPGAMAALSVMVEAKLGLSLPSTPLIARGASHDLIWAGPDQWSLRAASRDGFAALIDELSAQAAVSDQSDARAVLRISGPRVRDLLAKGVMLDLHPDVFAVGAAALTSIAYIAIHLWRLDDAAEGAVFEIAVPRSMAGSFWSWFAASAGEFGCRVTSGRG